MEKHPMYKKGESVILTDSYVFDMRDVHGAIHSVLYSKGLVAHIYEDSPSLNDNVRVCYNYGNTLMTIILNIPRTIIRPC